MSNKNDPHLEIAVVRQQVVSLQELLQERFQTQTKALEAALAAQQLALRTSLEAAEKAVTLALSNAEKAVNKAEIASEKRLEGLNEFRQELSDRTATFIPRRETEARFNAVEDKLTTETTFTALRFQEMSAFVQTTVRETEKRLTSQIATLATSRDINVGVDKGAEALRSVSQNSWRTVAAIAAVGSVLVSIIAIIVVIVLH